MKTTLRERRYAQAHFHEVHHTTLDPEGPGVVRIHLVPPVLKDGEVGASVAILNGQDVIPVNRAWSILLTEFIEEVNRYAGREITDADAREIVRRTVEAVRKVYPLTGRKRLERDIHTIMQTFRKVARGEPADEQIAALRLGDYAPLMRAPHRMDLLVSAMTRDGAWNCNQRCVHCYAAGQVHAEEPELSTEEWKKIIDRCREIGIPQLTFTGGEPTMREDLTELIDHARWFITRLNTNGVRLTRAYCARLRAASLDSVQITLYSADEAVHDTLVGAPHWKDTVAGIRNALAAGLSLSVNTPLCTLNRDYPATLRFLHEKGVRYVTCSGLITTGNAATGESERLQLTNAEIREVLQESVEYCFANGMEISFTSPGWVDEDFCTWLGITTPSCGACLSNMAVTPGGSVVPCQSWLNGETLGSLLTDDWAEIWSGEACVRRRNFAAQMRGECPLRIPRKREEAAR